MLELDIKSTTFCDFIDSSCMVVEKEGEPTRIVFRKEKSQQKQKLDLNMRRGNNEENQ